jgi:hypothetical protein
MNIGSVAFNDPVANFFKAVETARQRNTSAFKTIKPMASFEKTAGVHAQIMTAAPSKHAQQPIGVNSAPPVAVQGQQQVRTRILGNFFDAYA